MLWYEISKYIILQTCTNSKHNFAVTVPKTAKNKKKLTILAGI